MKGANVTQQAGTYGAQGTAAAGNTPGARYGSVAWTDPAGTLWLFGGFGFAASGGAFYLNDLWKYVPATGMWTWVKGPNTSGQQGIYSSSFLDLNTPGSRYGAVGWTDNAGMLWLFGGRSSNQWFNDLWKYNPATNIWTWVKGSDNPNRPGLYGTQGVAAAGNSPGGRYVSATWTDKTGKLWLLGGYGYDINQTLDELNDLWVFNPATGNWTWMKGSTTINASGVYGTLGIAAAANTPGAREGSPVTWRDAAGALWLFGGFGHASSGNAGFLNDLWKYDLTSGNWRWVKGSDATNQAGVYGVQGTAAPGNVPSSRYLAGGWTDNAGAFWLFGGSVGVILNDLWKYDTASGNWTWMKGSNTAGQPGTYGVKGVPAQANKPGARLYPVAWKGNPSGGWIFGGSSSTNVDSSSSLTNDLWQLTPTPRNAAEPGRWLLYR